MPVEHFRDTRFQATSLAKIETANKIIAEYQADGLTLTLRQLYYQFVARDIIPNTQKEYKNLGSTINDARLAGLVDWDAIEDRTRNVRTISAWDSPAQIVQAVGRQYKEDLWENQDYRPEVWIEKDALVGVVERVCEQWRIPVLACRGYVSQSEQYAAGKRFEGVIAGGQVPVVFHFGDHDPSGIDMTRDNTERLEMFAREGVNVKRLALNYAQVERYSPPPNPAKVTDSRAPAYIKQFGKKSWELDALEPRVLVGLVEKAITGVVDMDKWDESTREEAERRDLLAKCATNWTKVTKYLGKLKD